MALRRRYNSESLGSPANGAREDSPQAVRDTMARLRHEARTDASVSGTPHRFRAFTSSRRSTWAMKEEKRREKQGGRGDEGSEGARGCCLATAGSFRWMCSACDKGAGEHAHALSPLLRAYSSHFSFGKDLGSSEHGLRCAGGGGTGACVDLERSFPLELPASNDA